MKRLPVTSYNPCLVIDSYETDRINQYPKDAVELSSYMSFRRTFPMLTASDEDAGYIAPEFDPRMVFFGVRYIVETYIAKKITHDDIDEAVTFFDSHGPGFTKYPFPVEEFRRVVDEFDGQIPIVVEALPGGSVVREFTPLIQITCSVLGLAGLVTWYEDIILHNWYPSEIATRSMRTMDDLTAAFDRSVDDDAWWKLYSRHHNFGSRAATCPEQMLIGGMAHLLAGHQGTDIVLAAHYAQMMNNGKPVASSIPATAHCSTSSHANEEDMVKNMVDRYGHTVFATVVDTNDDEHFVLDIVPKYAQEIIEKGGLQVLRPDSGNGIEKVLLCLHAAEKAFGSTTNDKGFKVLANSAVIQGNGMSPAAIPVLYKAVMDAGWSAENLAIGEGGKLMQNDLNRDLVSAGFKLNYIKFEDGTEKLAMKCPKDEPGKWSLPGKLAVMRDIAFPYDLVPEERNQFRVYYDGLNGGLTENQDIFSDMILRSNEQWKAALELWTTNVISPELQSLQEDTAAKLHSK